MRQCKLLSSLIISAIFCSAYHSIVCGAFVSTPIVDSAKAFLLSRQHNTIVSSQHDVRPTSLYVFGGSKEKRGPASFIPDLPNNPFDLLGGGSSQSSIDITGGLPTAFEPTPDGYIFQAKRFLASDLGLFDPTLLDDTKFRWIDGSNPASNGGIALTKTEYVAAGRYFNLRGAFPDIDYRAHDYRYVGDNTVRFTRRVQGTMRGELRLRGNEVLPPSGLKMKCPPEAISITFDPITGKVVKLCTGFVLDRLVGNTAGTTGVVAASIIAGKPAVSDWDLYPPATVVSRIFARPTKPLDEAESFLAPFPEQVMIQLAKGILTSNLGADDPSLLSDDDFTFITPTVGPVRKNEFLKKYATAEFDGISDPNFSSFRVDPYDPVRVWVDLQPSGPAYDGPPQAMSLAFDDNGYCTRITSWAVLDPSIGNAGGLGGPEGYKYATGKASSSFVSRPFPSLLGRIRKTVLSPITGVKVDEYSTISGPGFASGSSIPKIPSPPKDVPSLPIKPVVVVQPPPLRQPEPPATDIENFTTKAEASRAAAAADVLKRLEAIKDIGASIRILPSISIQNPQPPTLSRADRAKQEADAAAKKQEAESSRKKRAEKEAAAEQKKKQAEKEKAERKAAIAAQKAATEEARLQKQAEIQREKEVNRKNFEVAKAAATAAEAKRKQQLETQKAVIAADEARRKKALETERATQEALKKKQAADVKKQQEQEKERKAKERILAQAASASKVKAKEVVADQQEREEAALTSLLKAASRATISLFGLGGGSKDDDNGAGRKVVVARSPTLSVKATSPPKRSAPAGVPTLTRWRQNSDKSITGLVKGSKGFTDGSRITTSPIATGTISSGQLVTTGSGSRYFLE